MLAGVDRLVTVPLGELLQAGEAGTTGGRQGDPRPDPQDVTGPSDLGFAPIG